MTNVELRTLNILEITEGAAASLWKFQRRKIMPVPKDIVVLHPDLPEILRTKKDRPTYVALHATLGEVDYICRLAMLTDEEIITATKSPYRIDQVEEWLSLGYNMFPFLKGGDMAMAGTQLRIALEDNVVRSFQR